jgi:pimeloyl-ACP methyl ester carboxylesterase
MPYAAVNGLSMYYDSQGEGSPLLLLHGGMASVPERWVPFFVPHFRVIAPEQMGQGRTADLVDRPFHYHDMAEDTVELMRHLGIERASVVGYSDGGIVGLDMAIHHPRRVTKLVVTGSVARFEGNTPGTQEFLRTLDPECEPVWDEYVQLSPDGAEHWPVVLERLKPMWATEPTFSDEELRAIETPTLLIIGDRDIVRPEHAAEMSSTIPNARLCIVPDAEHGVLPGDEVLTFLM